MALGDVLAAASGYFAGIPLFDDSGRCVHPCCPSPCEDPSHTQFEIDWPPIEQQITEAERELAKHRGPLDQPHRRDCHDCYVLEGLLHGARSVASMVGEEW